MCKLSASSHSLVVQTVWLIFSSVLSYLNRLSAWYKTIIDCIGLLCQLLSIKHQGEAEPFFISRPIPGPLKPPLLYDIILSGSEVRDWPSDVFRHYNIALISSPVQPPEEKPVSKIIIQIILSSLLLPPSYLPHCCDNISFHLTSTQLSRASLLSWPCPSLHYQRNTSYLLHWIKNLSQRNSFWLPAPCVIGFIIVAHPHLTHFSYTFSFFYSSAVLWSRYLLP